MKKYRIYKQCINLILNDWVKYYKILWIALSSLLGKVNRLLLKNGFKKPKNITITYIESWKNIYLIWIND